MDSNRDSITLNTASLYQAAYTVPLCTLFFYFSKLMLFGPSVIQLSGMMITEDLHISFSDSLGKPYLQGFSEFHLAEGHSPVFCRFQQNAEGMGCLEVPHHQMVKVIEDDSGVDNVSCFLVRREGLRCVNQMVKDCYQLGSSHWYGGFGALHQRWPLRRGTPEAENGVLEEEQTTQSTSLEVLMGPYVTADSGMHKTELQTVLDRLFISSSGVGIMVSEESPLYLSFDQHGDRQLCLAAMYDGAHYLSQQGRPPVLEYTVCKAPDVRQIHDYMHRRFIRKPQGIPSPSLFSKPIWSTWAMYNRDINQSAVMEYAENLEKYQLPCAQLEIDDKWAVRYGDMNFDPEKFPNPEKMIADLGRRGFPVSLWTHPFFNLDSQAFLEAHDLNYLVRMRGSEMVALVKWWNGQLAGLLDITNPAAALWYHSRLTALQEKYNVTSFKFDAGEAQFVPPSHSTHVSLKSTNEYSARWAEFAVSTDPVARRLEVRTAWHTQHLPVFLRLFDRMSSWGEDGGLRTVIPSVLAMSVMGYPFILPDMIGGNAYTDDDTFRHGAFPERELYIRWLQINVFLPSLQFSIAPWVYDDEVVAITKSMLDLRQKHVPRILQLARDSVQTGHPIIRPLWWVDAQSEEALVVDDQFLLGNDLLVAPVVSEGARKRDVFLPDGYWKSAQGGQAIRGPMLVKDYPVPLQDLAYFERIKD